MEEQKFIPVRFCDMARLAELALRKMVKVIYPDGIGLMVTSCSVDEEGKQLCVYFDTEDGCGGVWHFNVEKLCDAAEQLEDGQ